MATRYWVGGTGNWSSTTRWSATSGGASGASVPIATDDVVINAASGSAFTITVNGSPTCATLTITPSATVGVQTLLLTSPLTVTGLFSMGATAGNRRTFITGSDSFAQNLSLGSFSSLADIDFRDIRVIGAAGTISGTRIGDRGGNTGITFSAAKTVYWVTLAGGNWSGTNWAATSGGGASTDNFPLAQDTAVIDNTGLNTSATVTWDNVITYSGSINMSSRTNAMTFATGTTATTIHGNWTNGSGTSITGTGSITFAGRNTQTITSAGKSFGTRTITVDSLGGTVQLGDAFSSSTTTVTLPNGTLTTLNFAFTLGALNASNSNVRIINLGSSTVTLSGANGLNIATTTNLTFNAGTSTVVSSAGNFTTGSNLTFYNLTFAPPATNAVRSISLSNNFTVSNTFSCSGTSVVQRVFLYNDTAPITLTINSILASDCDFYNITLAGAAAGAAPARAGNCGGNTGITFPGAKTVYWNLAGTQNWSATGWATSSGGSPSLNNFPLAQDTVVFDNAGAAGTVTLDSTWNVGSINASARTTAMTLDLSTNAMTLTGGLTFGTGVSTTGTTGSAAVFFRGSGTQTITTNGVVCNFLIIISAQSNSAIVQLGSALTISSGNSLSLSRGTFDAVIYAVTCGSFSSFITNSGQTLKMGSATWTLSGVNTVWSVTSIYLDKGTANIVLSDTSTTIRQFLGGYYAYNTVTIGGTTGTSTTAFDSCFFATLASTKTVAHTIDITSTMALGAWTVSGTAGNVVTVSGAGSITIAGARVSGVNYLALGTTVISPTSPGEFYAGPNSTGGVNAILTAAPAAVTRYWRGGSGTWDATTTTNWSATSGGAGGASVPTSADAVIFNSASNATSYTVTLTATQARCAALTIAGPASGSITLAGTTPLAIHGNLTLPASGLGNTYTGTITFSGSAAGRTITPNGNTLISPIEINGVNCGWTLASAFTTTELFSLNAGTFATGNFSVSTNGFQIGYSFPKTWTLGSSTWTSTATAVSSFYITTGNLTFNKGTSTLVSSGDTARFDVYDGLNNVGSLDINNISFTSVSGPRTFVVYGSLTANVFSVTGPTSSVGQGRITFNANSTFTTLTLSAGTSAVYRTMICSDVIGTARTLTVGTITAGTIDYDFRDITIAGAAAPAGGTRLGNCGGNTGISFNAGQTRYWNLAGGGNWSSTGWANISGGTPNLQYFPLAQDTAIFEATGLNSGATITFTDSYNIGTINMSARTSNTMTLDTSAYSPSVYGNWINGTGVTMNGSSPITFLGRGSQTLTSAGRTFTQPIAISSFGGSLTLQDALNITGGSPSISLNNGTFNVNGFSVTTTGTLIATGDYTRELAIGSATLTIGGSGTGAFAASGAAGSITITGTGTISMTSASAKSFSGGSNSYSGITLNQGGAGALTISGNNTFKDITNTYSATGASSIVLAASSTQRLTQFTGTGEATRLLSISAAATTTFAKIIITGVPNVNYITPSAVRAYVGSTFGGFYIGNNSTNGTLGSSGFVFAQSPSTNQGNFLFFMFA